MAIAQAVSDGKLWGEVAYQRGDRSSNGGGSGYSNNLYQLVFGADVYSDAQQKTKFGAGVSLANTLVTANGGNSTLQQGALFVYGKMPLLDEYVVDGSASLGLSSADLSRSDVTGLSNGFKNKGVMGNDVLLSLGVSRAFAYEGLGLTPFARVTYQQVNQSSYNENIYAYAGLAGEFRNAQTLYGGSLGLRVLF
jgi:outer membrane autotransporter protein